MTTRPSPSPRPSPTGPAAPVPADAAARLLAVADALASIAEVAPGPPDLVGVIDVADLGAGADPGAGVDPHGRPDALTFTTLGGPDPVARLVGLTALPPWWAVGLVAGATARPLEGGARRDHVGFVHLVARDGTAVTVFDDGRGARVVEGPDREPQVGRVPDLCRRVLGLPTAPPPCGVGPHLVDVWLTRLVQTTVDRPSLSWAAAAALHPAADRARPPASAPSPAELVRATTAADHPDRWDTYLRACRAEGHALSGRLDASALAWLDPGSFSRWLLGEAAPWRTMLDHLDAVLPTATADRVFATVALSRPSPWPLGPGGP